MSRPITHRFALALLAMASVVATPLVEACHSLHHMTSDSKCDLWEIACSPTSQLSEAVTNIGGKVKRVTYATGYNLKLRGTIEIMKKEFLQEKPKELWISLPCKNWSSQQNFFTHDPAYQKQLDSRRRDRCAC